MRLNLLLCTALLVPVACNKRALTDDISSGLSDLVFTLPEGAGTLYTGYSVSFSRYGSFEANDACSPNKSWAKDTASRNVTITYSVKNGCDYLIVLELGQVNAAKNGLDKVYFTNRNVEAGTIVRASQLTGGDVDVTIKVFKTKDAPADAPGELQTQQYSNLRIDVTFDTGDGSAPGPNAGRRAPAPPGGSNPNPPPSNPGTTLTAFEQKLQSLQIKTHAGATDSVFNKVNGKDIFLVKFSWVDCGPCDSLHSSMEADTALKAIADKCPILTVVLPGRGGLEQYQPSSSYYQDPYTIGRELGTGFSGGFPYTAIMNRKTGVVMQRSGADYSVIDRFKQMCQ